MAGALFAIHVVLTALPPGNRLVRVLQNAWQAFWGLLFLSTAIGILFFLCGLGMLIAGLLTGNLWLMLLGFIIVEAVAIGFSAGLSVVGLGPQAHTAMLAGAVVMITAAIIRFGLLVGQNLIAPAIAGPVVGSILVVSVSIWILTAFICGGDPRKYARACANVAIWWWVVFAILAVYRGSDFLRSVVDRWVGAPSEVQTVENKLGATILRHQNRLSEEKLRHILGSNVSPVYIDLEGFDKKVLYGYDDSGRLIGETVGHGEQVSWYEQRPIPNAVQTVLEGTNAVYIRKKDLNGMPTTAGVGMWIPFEKRREGEKIFTFIVSEKPQPLTANPDEGELSPKTLKPSAKIFTVTTPDGKDIKITRGIWSNTGYKVDLEEDEKTKNFIFSKGGVVLTGFGGPAEGSKPVKIVDGGPYRAVNDLSKSRVQGELWIKIE